MLGDPLTNLPKLASVMEQPEYCEPPGSRVYISAESASNMTVSGPPSVLSRFVASASLAGLKKLKLPVFAAFHAPHLPQPDAAWLMAAAPPTLLSRRLADAATLISCSTAQPYAGETVSDVFPQVVADVFENKLLDGRALDSALSSPDSDSGVDCPLIVDVVGPASVNTVKRAVERAGLPDV